MDVLASEDKYIKLSMALFIHFNQLVYFYAENLHTGRLSSQVLKCCHKISFLIMPISQRCRWNKYKWCVKWSLQNLQCYWPSGQTLLVWLQCLRGKLCLQNNALLCSFKNLCERREHNLRRIYRLPYIVQVDVGCFFFFFPSHYL